VPQNGEFIIVEPHVSERQSQDYLEAISGIGVEDLFCNGEMDENNPWHPDIERIEILASYRERAIPVFSVEYLTDEELIDRYRTEAESRDYIPYVTVRALDRLYPGLGTNVQLPYSHFNDDYLVLSPYPNPFNGEITVPICSAGSGELNFTVTNVLGQTVYSNQRQIACPGELNIAWNGCDLQGRRLGTGLYLITLSFNGQFHRILPVALLK
jgi:hypothetical protein